MTSERSITSTVTVSTGCVRDCEVGAVSVPTSAHEVVVVVATGDYAVIGGLVGEPAARFGPPSAVSAW